MKKLTLSVQITNRDTENFSRYLNDVKKIKLLSPEQEVALAAKIKMGDPLSKEILIRSNTRFVVSVAKMYQSYGISLGDLIAEGNLGLIAATERYDPSKGFKFISFAVWYIQQYIYKFINDNKSLIRIPVNQNIIVNKIRKASQEIEQENGRPASDEEIADFCGFPLTQVKDCWSNPGKVISLDSLINENENLTLIDVVEDVNSPMPDECLIQDSAKNRILEFVYNLKDREQIVICHCHGILGYQKLTLEQIGEMIMLSTESVRKIKKVAMSKLFLFAKKNPHLKSI
ncbi:RNA polymerase primary sigma factor [Pedobacter sp. UYP24]